MRLLKFRAWNEREKIMETPDNIANDIDGEKYQIMQFTGLLDRNSKEIYEGDIIIRKDKHTSSRDEYQVKWHFGGFLLCRNLSDYRSSMPYSDEDEIGFLPIKLPNIACELEVIGNIYEPELLKEDKNGRE